MTGIVSYTRPDRKDTTMATVSDIQDGDAVRAFISTGQAVLECQAVQVVRMLAREGDPTHARLNNADPDWWPIGGRFAGPTVPLNMAVTRDDAGVWQVAL
jgi:hypothetical protein